MVEFVRGNDVYDTYSRTYDSAWQRRERQRQLDEQQALDDATRQGIHEMRQGGALDAIYAQPAGPSTFAGPAPPTITMQPARPEQTFQPTPAPPGQGGIGSDYVASERASANPFATIDQYLTGRESSGNWGAHNSAGYVGALQYGEDRLRDLQMYDDPTPRNRSGQGPEFDWTGTINVPGFGPMNVEQFKANPDAQRAVNQAHFADLDQQIRARGYDRLIGQTVGGVTITRDGLMAAAHIGGWGGVDAFVRSGGAENRRDSNGTSVGDYLAMRQPGSPGGMTAQPGGTISGPTHVGQPAVDYRPLLDRLVATPGGGQQALATMGSMIGRGDQAAALERQQRDADERNALTALGRGDMEVYAYYANRIGLQLPEQILNDRTAQQLFARGALLAERLYRNSDDQAAAFMSAYMQSGGNVGIAYAQAGPPADRPNITIRQVEREGQLINGMFDDQWNYMGELADDQGQPLRPTVRERGSAGGRSYKEIALAEWMVANGIAATPDEAWWMMQQSKQNPTEAIRKIQADVAKEIAEDFNWRNRSPDEIAAEIERRVQERWNMVQQMAAEAAPGGSIDFITAGPQVAPPGQAAPQAAPAPPPATGRRMIYDEGQHRLVPAP